MHLFCGSCLRKHWKENKFNCPVCREEFGPPEEEGAGESDSESDPDSDDSAVYQ
jgi:hypothetical protein